jgi:hypothetical protein
MIFSCIYKSPFSLAPDAWDAPLASQAPCQKPALSPGVGL